LRRGAKTDPIKRWGGKKNNSGEVHEPEMKARFKETGGKRVDGGNKERRKKKQVIKKKNTPQPEYWESGRGGSRKVEIKKRMLTR